MAYTKPNSFTNGAALTGPDIKGNDDALKVYLHEGVVAGDLKATSWIETRHLQPPILEPVSGIQHGVTGVQGSQWTGGVGVKCQFATAFLTAARSNTTNQSSWAVIPQTTMQFTLRGTAKVIFHWWMESTNGPDNSGGSAGADGYLYASEYTAGGLLAGTGLKSIVPTYATECVSNHQGWQNNPPGGALYPYTLLGYGNMAGTTVFPATDTVVVGLAHLSTIDRSAIINWGINIEAYYL
tara:strand:- start:1078 stop:1794 length:717 start_codon:yes stop_codon:yes gene_type:complete